LWQRNFLQLASTLATADAFLRAENGGQPDLAAAAFAHGCANSLYASASELCRFAWF